MRFDTSKAAFEGAVDVVADYAAKSSPIAVRTGILLRAHDGTLDVTATNGEESMRDSCPAAVEEDGEAVVSGKLLKGLVKALPSDHVRVAMDGDTMTVRCGRSSYRLHTLPASDFPEFPDVAPDQSVEMPYSVFDDVLGRVHRAASKDASRPVLSGAVMTVRDGRLSMVATDSYRLCLCETPIGGDTEFEAVVPASNLAGALRRMTSDEVTVSASESQVVMRQGAMTYVTRRVEGRYPDVSVLMPQSHAIEAHFDAAEMADAIKRIRVMTGSNPGVRFDVGEGAVTLYASSPDQGDATEVVTADTVGSTPIALNVNYVFDGVSCMGGEVSFELDDAMHPAVLRSHGSVDMTYLMMPVRI